jgi:hypothetical protein
VSVADPADRRGQVYEQRDPDHAEPMSSGRYYRGSWQCVHEPRLPLGFDVGLALRSSPIPTRARRNADMRACRKRQANGIALYTVAAFKPLCACPIPNASRLASQAR